VTSTTNSSKRHELQHDLPKTVIDEFQRQIGMDKKKKENTNYESPQLSKWANYKRIQRSDESIRKTEND